MEDDYFSEPQGQTITASQTGGSQRQQDNDDAFDFGESGNDYQMGNTNNNSGQESPTYNDPFVQDQNIKRMREEDDRINQMLRTKANQEYEQKQRRKQEGRKQLQEFLDKKQKEKDERKEDNLKKQEQLKKSVRTLNETAGWRKVIANVPLKQGEHPGSKDTNRMREAILRKRQDLDREEGQ